MGTSVLLPPRELPREGGRGSRGVPFPLPSRGGGGAQRTALPTPGVGGEPEELGAPRGGAPGERCGASPSQSRPPPPARPSGRLCRREPQQRRLPCAVGVSASLEPAAPAPPGNTPSAGAGAGAPPEKRAALSRVLTAERPARRSRVSASSERPLQEGPRASTQD
ncbi:Zinc Finger Protein 28 [Manis pentadactyla]|nr:Zinc Finger Protein 28 [Manis pentadactyla]